MGSVEGPDRAAHPETRAGAGVGTWRMRRDPEDWGSDAGTPTGQDRWPPWVEPPLWRIPQASASLSPPLQALGVPRLVATSLQPLPLWSPGLLLGLCVLFSYKDTVIGPEPLLQEHLIFARSCLQKPYFCLRWGGKPLTCGGPRVRWSPLLGTQEGGEGLASGDRPGLWSEACVQTSLRL